MESIDKSLEKMVMDTMSKQSDFTKLPEVFQNLFVGKFVEVLKAKFPFVESEILKISNLASERYVNQPLEDIKELKIKMLELFNKYELLKTDRINNQKKIENVKKKMEELRIYTENRRKEYEKKVLEVDFYEELMKDQMLVEIDREIFNSMKDIQLEEINFGRMYGIYIYLENLSFVQSGITFFKSYVLYEAFLSENPRIIMFHKPINRDIVKDSKEILNRVRNLTNNREKEEKEDEDYIKGFEENIVKKMFEIDKDILNEMEVEESFIDKEAKILDLELFRNHLDFILKEINIYFANKKFNLKTFDLNGFVEEIKQKNLKMEESIEEVIGGGESEFVEFKETLLWDVREGKKNNELSNVIAKEIVAFLNTKGGKLFIGVTDEGTVCGLERDFKIVKNNNLDGFQLRLSDLIKTKIGLGFMNFIEIKFHEIESNLVCEINVKKSDLEAYFDNEEFYIRVLTSSKRLSAKEAIEYVKTRN